jgi:hypothetical protein
MRDASLRSGHESSVACAHGRAINFGGMSDFKM